MKKHFASPDQSRPASLPSFMRRIGSGYQSADLIPSFGVKDHLFVVIEYE
jgi:hypothetical protein